MRTSRESRSNAHAIADVRNHQRGPRRRPPATVTGRDIRACQIWRRCAWEKEQVELFIHGKSFITIPRMNMMWFFFFDIIHHRGQLSSYVRPMGGKNPAVYGYSADTII